MIIYSLCNISLENVSSCNNSADGATFPVSRCPFSFHPANIFKRYVAHWASSTVPSYCLRKFGLMTPPNKRVWWNDRSSLKKLGRPHILTWTFLPPSNFFFQLFRKVRSNFSLGYLAENLSNAEFVPKILAHSPISSWSLVEHHFGMAAFSSTSVSAINKSATVAPSAPDERKPVTQPSSSSSSIVCRVIVHKRITLYIYLYINE